MIAIPIRMAGRYRFDAVRPDGRVRPILGWSGNLILDAGLDEIAETKTWLDTCHVGSSDTPPESTQTALASPVAATANRVAANSSAVNSAPFKGSSQITYRFPVGAFYGQTIREVGVGSTANNGDPLFSRALALDALGDPTAVEVLDDEYLDVTYELSVIVPPDDVSGQFTVIDIEGGDSIVSYVQRSALASTGAYWAPYNAANYESDGQAVRGIFATGGGAYCQVTTGVLGSITSQPGGDTVNVTNVINEDYEEGSHKRVARIRFGDSVANFEDGTQAALIRMANASGSGGSSLGAYQVQFSPSIEKTANFAMYLEVEMSWGRA